jgi:hypothetical protein
MTGALHGHLYGMQNGQLFHLASSHDQAHPALHTAMADFIAHANEAQSEATALVDSEIGMSTMDMTITGAGDSAYIPFSILADDDSTQVVAGIALAFAPDTRRAPAPRLLIAVGEELTARGDLTRMTVVR